MASLMKDANSFLYPQLRLVQSARKILAASVTFMKTSPAFGIHRITTPKRITR